LRQVPNMVSWRTEIIHHGRAIVAKIVRELIDAASAGILVGLGIGVLL